MGVVDDVHLFDAENVHVELLSKFLAGFHVERPGRADAIAAKAKSIREGGIVVRNYQTSVF